MTTAREIIAGIRYKPISMATAALGEPGADTILAALTAAGFRVLAPEEVDPVTVEKCAAIADEHTKAGCTTPDGSQTSAMRLGAASIAAMIRVLKGENQ